MREHVKADEAFEREDVTPGRGDGALHARGPGLQGRADRGPGREHRGRDRLALHQRPVHRPLPRAARALDQAHPRVQAAQRGRRLLARRREPPDAHAGLRHRLPLQGGARGAPRAPRAGARRATTASSGRELELFMFSELSPGSPFWQPNGMVLWNALTDLWRGENAARGYREVKTPILYDVELFKTSGHWDVYREHMYFTDVEDRAMGLKPMNCPGARAALQGRAALLPRPPDPLLRGRARAPPRAQRHAARAAARPPHHPGRRPHLLHRGADPGGGQPLPGLRLRDLRPVRLRAAARALDPAGEAHRHRGDVGPGGAGARGRARAARRASTTSTRATARSTARRSICT